MKRAITVLVLVLAAPVALAGASVLPSTEISVFSPRVDTPGSTFRIGDPVHVVAYYFAPGQVCGSAAFTLTDSHGKKYNLDDIDPGFGQWGEGYINTSLKPIPNGAAYGPGVVDSNQTCRDVGHVRGHTDILIIDPTQARPKVSQVTATDAVSGGGTSKLTFTLDRYAEVSVAVQWQFVPGDWRSVAVVADDQFYAEAGTYSTTWTAQVGGALPAGTYRYVVTPHAPTVGDGAVVTRDFSVIPAGPRKRLPRSAGPRGKPSIDSTVGSSA
jgi:hypothetical protein